ncbi:hypothetical protein QJQ45_010123 [Haematococcus lacustris]|nr:hypothetical protein QJQ45_010123 [Haematococcus lacustris]
MCTASWWWTFAHVQSSQVHELGSGPGLPVFKLCALLEHVTANIKALSIAQAAGQNYRDSGITRQAEATKTWLAQVKPQRKALSQVSSRPSSLASYRQFADTVLATYDAMWAEVSKPRWANAKFRLNCGKQRVVASFGILWMGGGEESRGLGQQGELMGQEPPVGLTLALTIPAKASIAIGDLLYVIRVGSREVFRVDRLANLRFLDLRLLRPALSQQRDQPVRGIMWWPVVAPRKPPQPPRSSQAATLAASTEPGPSTPSQAKRSKRTKAEQAAEPTQPTQPTKGKAAKAKPAPQPGRWLDRDCNAALNMQHIGESRWRPLEQRWWPETCSRAPTPSLSILGLRMGTLKREVMKLKKQLARAKATQLPPVARLALAYVRNEYQMRQILRSAGLMAEGCEQEGTSGKDHGPPTRGQVVHLEDPRMGSGPRGRIDPAHYLRALEMQVDTGLSFNAIPKALRGSIAVMAPGQQLDVSIPCARSYGRASEDIALTVTKGTTALRSRIASAVRARAPKRNHARIRAVARSRYAAMAHHPTHVAPLAEAVEQHGLSNMETALKPLSSNRVDRMGAAQVAAHVKAHTEPLHTWYQYITEDSLAANRAAKRRCVADAKAPSCLLVATPINTAASPSLSAATNGADIPSPHPTPAPAHTSTPTSSAITAGAQAVNRRKLQEQHRRQKRAAAELSITMRFASTETRQRCKATAVEQQLAAKELANNRARMATQQVQAMAMYSSTIQPLPQNTLKLTLHQLRHLWGVVGKGPPARTVGGLLDALDSIDTTNTDERCSDL